MNTEYEFLNDLFLYDLAWIISDTKLPYNISERNFTDNILQYLAKGRGLMLWNDAEHFYHTNIILSHLPIGKDK